jgi:hypothetical protein
MRRLLLASSSVLVVSALAACDDPSALDGLDPSTFTAQIRGDRTANFAGTAIFIAQPENWIAYLLVDEDDWVQLRLGGEHPHPSPGVITWGSQPANFFVQVAGEQFLGVDGFLRVVSSSPTAVAGDLEGRFVGLPETSAAGDTIRVVAAFRATGDPPNPEP